MTRDNPVAALMRHAMSSKSGSERDMIYGAVRHLVELADYFNTARYIDDDQGPAKRAELARLWDLMHQNGGAYVPSAKSNGTD